MLVIFTIVILACFLILSAIFIFFIFYLFSVTAVPPLRFIVAPFIFQTLIFSGVLIFFQYKHNDKIKKIEEKLAVHQVKEANQEIIIQNHEKNIDAKNAIIHDIKNNVSLLISIANNPDAFKSYLQDLTKLYDNQLSHYKFDTKNSVLDSILGKLQYDCQKNNIKLDFDIKYGDFNFISSVDASSLFGNIFDNALYACCRLNTYRWINVSFSRKNNIVIISVSNSKANNIIEKNGKFYSCKRDYKKWGNGINIIKSVVKKYKGNTDFEYDENSFRCFLWLNRPG